MGQLEIHIKMQDGGIAADDELALRHRFQDEIERRGIGKDLGGGSGFGVMDIDVEVTSDMATAKSKLRALAEELGVKDGLTIEEYVAPGEGSDEKKECSVDELDKENSFGELVFSYTRAQAIEDGVLVDVSEMAREAGIIYSTALTIEVYERYVAVPAGLEGCQDEAGRLWDIVNMLRFAILRGEEGESEIPVQLRVQNDTEGAKLAKLKALCGPGDEGEPVITVMLPHED